MQITALIMRLGVAVHIQIRFFSKTLPDLRGAGCPLPCTPMVCVVLCSILAKWCLPSKGWDSSRAVLGAQEAGTPNRLSHL